MSVLLKGVLAEGNPGFHGTLVVLAFPYKGVGLDLSTRHHTVAPKAQSLQDILLGYSALLSYSSKQDLPEREFIPRNREATSGESILETQAVTTRPASK